MKSLHSFVIAGVLCGAHLVLGQTQTLPPPKPANTLLTSTQCPGQDEAAMGFKLLGGSIANFEANFAQWIQNNSTNTALPSGWSYAAGDSTIVSTGSTSDLRSEKTYVDFDLRLSYKNDGNQGIFYKMLTTGPTTYDTGVEFAIENVVDVANKKTTVGAAYDMFAPNPPASQVYNPFTTLAASKWNDVRIVVKGDSVEHWLNNVKIVSYKFWKAPWNAAFNASKWVGEAPLIYSQNTSGCKCTVVNGYIGFQGGHGGKWSLRNMRITGDSASVKLGPANCGSIGILDHERLSGNIFSLERTQGSVRLRLKDGMFVTKAEVMGLNGHVVGKAQIENKGTSLLLHKSKSPGIYIVSMTLNSDQIVNAKVFLP